MVDNSKTFDKFLEFVKWMYEEHTNHHKSHNKAIVNYDDYLNANFKFLCDEFHNRIVH